ncbi:MAG: hypothetical protein AAFU85_02360 [Planctomycetota bacterium]
MIKGKKSLRHVADQLPEQLGKSMHFAAQEHGRESEPRVLVQAFNVILAEEGTESKRPLVAGLRFAIDSVTPGLIDDSEDPDPRDVLPCNGHLFFSWLVGSSP